MSILKALKNFIAKCGVTTEAKTIAGAINDIPASGGEKIYEIKTIAGSGDLYIDGLTYDDAINYASKKTSFKCVEMTYTEGHRINNYYYLNCIDLLDEKIDLVVFSTTSATHRSFIYDSEVDKFIYQFK